MAGSRKMARRPGIRSCSHRRARPVGSRVAQGPAAASGGFPAASRPARRVNFAFGSMHAAARHERRGLDAETAHHVRPHPVVWDVEYYAALGGREQPRALGELVLELAWAPTRITQ